MEIYKNEWGDPEDLDGTVIDAEVLPDGSIRLAGTDFGKSARDFSGRDEYEYGLHIPSDHMSQFALELLKRSFNLRGLLTMSKVERVRKNADIPVETWSY